MSGQLTGESRRQFLRATFAGGGALVVGGVVLGVPKLAASAPARARDVPILNFLLLLEYAQAALYDNALQRGDLEDDLLEFARVARNHEQEHIEALRARLGKRARKKPEFDFDEQTEADRFAAAASALEENACAAYIGQSGNLSRHLRPTVAGIVSIEARHAAWIRHILGRHPAPSAADPVKKPDEVMRSLRRRELLTTRSQRDADGGDDRSESDD